jgi:hypothetical protein
MMRPVRRVKEQVDPALGMHCGARGHGAFAPRLRGGVRRQTASRSSLLFVATGFAAPTLFAAAGFGYRQRKICAFSERSSSQRVAVRPVGEKSPSCRPARLARHICTSASSGAVETPDRNVATRLHSVGVTAESTDGGLTHGCEMRVPPTGLSRQGTPPHHPQT